MIMRRNPCHDTDNPPGQITSPPQKMTFDEWVLANKDNKNHPVGYFNLYNVGKGDMDQESYFFFEELWKAAQENI